jgi:hypothetical protein
MFLAGLVTIARVVINLGVQKWIGVKKKILCVCMCVYIYTYNAIFFSFYKKEYLVICNSMDGHTRYYAK